MKESEWSRVERRQESRKEIVNLRKARSSVRVPRVLVMAKCKIAFSFRSAG